MAIFSVFLTGAATFSSKQLLNCIHKAEWTLFQVHYFSENLAVPEIEPRTSGSVASLTTRPQRRMKYFDIENINKNSLFAKEIAITQIPKKKLARIVNVFQNFSSIM
jgi:hypothetical protein